jgi:hypothetical protein
MANTDKDILITPNNGSSSADPKIEFKGADASTSAQTITATAYPTNNGTLSFDGSAGQLFSITNDMTGTIFSVNDVSGIPSIEVDDDGTIRLAEYSGNVLIGQSTDSGEKLQVERDTDNSAEIGRAHIGYVGWPDYAGFSHVDANGQGSYALLANASGGSYLNAASGNVIELRNNNVSVGNISSSGLAITNVDVSGNVQIGSEVVLQESTDRADLLQITSTTSGWGGLQIRNSSNEGRWSFMTDGETAGIYNDEDNQWHMYLVENAASYFYYAGSTKLATTSTGIDVTGTAVTDGLTVDGDSSLNGKVYAQSRSEKVRTLTTTSGNIQVYLTEYNGTDPDSIIWCTADATADRNISLTYDTTKRGTDIAHTVTVLFTNGATPYKMGSFWQGGAFNPSTNSTTIIFPTAIKWQGGSAPAAGNANSIDAYTFTYLYNGSAVQVIGSGPNQFA